MTRPDDGNWRMLKKLSTKELEYLEKTAASDKKRADQLGVNCHWLIARIDEIFSILCPDKLGTWQYRADEAVKAVKA